MPFVDGLEPDPTVSVPPPSSATSSCDNRPADYVVVLDVGWNVLPAQKPDVSSEGFWFAAGQANTLSLVTASDAPLSSPGVLRIGFPKGSPGGSSPSRWGSTPDFPANQGGAYVCIWVRMSADYSNNGNVGTKLFFLHDGVNNHYAGFDSPDRDRGAFLMTGLQFPDNRLANNLGQVQTPSNNIAGGGWHKIEVIWQANRPGVKDGRYRQWVDGVLTSQSNTVMFFLAGQTPHWKQIWFIPPSVGAPIQFPTISGLTWIICWWRSSRLVQLRPSRELAGPGALLEQRIRASYLSHTHVVPSGSGSGRLPTSHCRAVARGRKTKPTDLLDSRRAADAAHQTVGPCWAAPAAR